MSRLCSLFQTLKPVMFHLFFFYSTYAITIVITILNCFLIFSDFFSIQLKKLQYIFRKLNLWSGEFISTHTTMEIHTSLREPNCARILKVSGLNEAIIKELKDGLVHLQPPDFAKKVQIMLTFLKDPVSVTFKSQSLSVTILF